MMKTVLFVLACACASKPESLTVGANSNSNGKNYETFRSSSFKFVLDENSLKGKN